MNKVKDFVRQYRSLILTLLVFLFLAIFVYNFARVSNVRTVSPSYPIYATPIAVQRVMATPDLLKVGVSQSGIWKVTRVLEPVKISGYTYAVLEFADLATGQIKIGQCQQPAWPMPEVGHQYLLKNTYSDYWLFVPIEGIDSYYQRFLPLN